MVELCVRIVLAGLLVFAAGLCKGLDFDLSWKAALAIAALAGFGYRLEERGFKNAGVAGFLAIADALVVAVMLANCDATSGYGFLVLAPLAYATRRYRANPLHMAPIAVAGLIAAEALVHGPKMPEAGVLLQGACILGIGMLFSQEKIIATLAQPVVHEVRGTSPSSPPDGFLELREKFSTLRDAYRQLEMRGRRERYAATLAEIRGCDPSTLFSAMAEKLSELTGADKVILYSIAGFDSALVVRASHGDVDRNLQTHSLDINPRDAIVLVRDRLDEALGSLRGEKSGYANVLLNSGGKIVGMVALIEDNRAILEEARVCMEDAADVTTSLMLEGIQREDSARRLREAEMLYDLATLAKGSTSRSEIARRFTRELKEILNADHMGVFLLDGDEALTLSREGRDVRLIEELSFGEGPGIRGWLKVGAPDLLMFDVRSDSRCPSVIALRVRVGSFFAVPIFDGEQVVGYVTAATDRIGGLDIPAAETIRVCAAELGRTLFCDDEQGGLMNPNDFRTAMEGRTGALVVLDPLRKEQLLNLYGSPALAHVLRKFSRRVRAKLPEGGFACRRAEGDIVVFLPEVAEPFAQSWANEMAATASMIGLRTPDGSTRVPLPVRAKVALLDPQNHQFCHDLTG